MDFRKFTVSGRYERIQAISTEELERRFAELRKILTNCHADALIVAAPNRSAEGMWIAGDKEADCILLGMEGPAVAIHRSRYITDENDQTSDTFADPSEKPWDTGLAPQVINLNQIGDETWKLLSLPDDPVFAVIHLDMMKVWQNNAVKKKFPNASYISVTEDFFLLRAKKSPFDQELYMESAKHNRKVLEMVPSILRLGKPYREANIEVMMATQRLWSYADGLSGIAPYLAEYNMTAALPYPGDRIKEDDIISILLETSGPGGHYVACARFWMFKEPSEDLLTRHRIASEANALAGKLMKPGTTMREIADEVNEFIRSKGYYTNDCCYLHGMGYVMCENLQIADNSVPNPRREPSEDIPLEEGMISLAHPMVGPTGGAEAVRTGMARYIESYQVTKDGGKKLTNTDEAIYVL